MAAIPSRVRVCIVGAGVAGLSAAQKLTKFGIENFVVLEAQDRIGGRVFTLEHGEHHLEMGAQWIHGEEGNAVFQWASENGLVDEDISLMQTGTGNTVFIRQSGEIVPDEVQEAFFMTIANISEKLEKDYSTFHDSLGQYYKEKFKAENKWGALGDELLNWQGRFQNCIDGSDSWFDVPAEGGEHYKECPGNPVVNWKKNGYQNLIHHLKENLPSSRLFLNTPVKSINWRTTTSSSSSGCKVTLASGQAIYADHTIFTASLGVLKVVAKEMFSPSLPVANLNAVEGLAIGVVNKIFLQFPHRWWDDNCNGFSFLRNLDEECSTITKENWEHELLGFYEVFKHPDMLCGWITGPAALLMEQVSEEEVAKACIAQLRRLLSHKFQIPDSVWCRRSSWGSNCWTRGSYSYRSMKTDAMGARASDLAEPLVDSNNTPVVCFAGEATHECYYSTVHGALESGWREADRLLKYLKSVPTSENCQPVGSRQKYNVVIVGAGAAGIGAARELNAQGIDSILILEGSNRFGGRVNTVRTVPQGVVELGAQWIHGEDGNAIFQFARSRNLLHHKLSVDGRGDFRMENGKLIDEHLVDEILDVMEEADEECKTYSQDKEFKEVRQLSVGDVFRRRFLEYLSTCKTDGPLLRNLKKALYYWTLRWYRIDNACDSLHQLSATCWGNYIYCNGKENMNPKDGFLSILSSILAETKADLLLNSEVDCIDYASEVTTDEGSYVRLDGTTYPVIVKCKDGSEFEAQHVIVTSSIGYLKNNPNLFFPALPRRLQKAITSMGYGTIDKIFLEYTDAWWQNDWEGLQIVRTTDIPDFERKAPHTRLCDGTTEQMSKYWVRAVSGFDPVFNQRAMLCGWIGGPEAEYMEGLSEHEVGRECTNLLRCFLNWDVPYPKKVYRSQWASDHFFQGSYSYHPLGCDCCSEDSENDLNVPVCALSKDGDEIPLLVLAGEANSRAYYSTVHGALQNGIEQTGHYVIAYRRLRGGRCSIKSKI
nr:spermine oxidase-like isoform X1 [Procambarus clarkii]XP_045601695.1 spermine oxidase-like isoform X1 [Procambarus clarkii]